MPDTTETPAPSTFADLHRQAFADAAVAEKRAVHDLRENIAGMLNVGRYGQRGEHLGEVITLDENVHVAQTVNSPVGTVWRVIVDDHIHVEAYLSKWVAVLAAVAVRHGAGDYAEMFAARVLRVPNDGNERTP